MSVTFVLALVLVPNGARADRSATLATAINLPSGPGSIAGNGQAHAISAASGLPTLTHPIAVPPGRAGLAPELVLRHDPGVSADVVGLGWTLPIPHIERSTRTGLAHDGDPTERPWILRNLGRGEELVPVSHGSGIGDATVLRERIEGERPVIVEQRADGGMRARLVDGMVLTFGSDAASRVARDGDVFRLLLDAVEDSHGNRVEYRYREHAGSDVPLLDTIVWNEGHASARFEYELRPDPVRTSAPGWRLVLGHRLRSVTTTADGDEVTTTTLTYRNSRDVPGSLLVSIATTAADGTATPTWTMTYRGMDEALPEPIPIAGAPALDPTADGRALVDVDGDALPDLLVADEPGHWRYRRNLGAFRMDDAWTELDPAPSLQVGPNTRFADVTGDGIEDLLVQPNPGAGEIWSHTGGGPTPFAAGEEPVTLFASVALESPAVALADLTLDGRVDLLFHHTAGDAAYVWIHDYDDPGRFHEAAAIPPAPDGMAVGDPGVQLVDMDGDRVPELVRVLKDDHRVLVATGLGLGLFDDPHELAGVPAFGPDDRVELRDLNGDGAADLLWIQQTSLSVWINQLDGGIEMTRALVWDPIDAGAGERVLLSDLDADGVTDVVRVRPDGDGNGNDAWTAWEPIASARPGLLTRFENGLGYSLALEYSTAAALAADADARDEPWAHTPPTATPVVTATHEDDGHGWTRTVAHGYRDGWFDAARGEFRGFAEVVERHEGDAHVEDRTIRRVHDLGREDEARKHAVLEVIAEGNGNRLRRTVHELTVREQAPGVRVARTSATEVVHLERPLPGSDDKDGQPARTREEWDHDGWGNVLAHRELGSVDADGDERTTVYTYATPEDDAPGPRDRVASTTVQGADGQRVTATQHFYDGEDHEGLPLGAVGERGALSRRALWIADDRWVDELRQTVDAFGNTIEVLDAEGGRLTRGYDSLGRFPVEERLHQTRDGDGDGSALVVTATWDARFGVPITLRDPSGAESSVVLDGLGRVIAEVEPGDSASLPTASHAYYTDPNAGGPAIVTTTRRDHGVPDVDLVTSHLDGLGRVRQRIAADPDTPTGAVLVEAFAYDISGEIGAVTEGQYVPAAALEPGHPAPLDPAWPRSEECRDALGRTLETRDADGYVSRTVYGPLSHDARDHEDLFSGVQGGRYADTPRRTHLDGLGRVTAIEDRLTDRVIVHRYTHDAAGRLVTHTDPDGHVTRYEHDGGGRLVRVESPDAGLIDQVFDDTGRLVERVDGTGARMTWSHDAIGRPRLIEQFDPDGEPRGRIRYHHDTPREADVVTAGLAPFGRGRLVGIDDEAGRLDLVHDARGRVVRSTRRFAAEGGEIVLSSGAVHDAQGRVIREVFPDGTTLDHDYGARGLERSVPRFVDAIEHDALGRWTSMELANGVTHTRALDRGGRTLEQLVRRGANRLRDVAHLYDTAGLLAETQDRVGATADSPALDRTFSHDDLRRLVRMQTTARGSDHGVLRWRYSDDGNLLQQGKHTLAYDGLQPHAATRLDGQRLFYDDAGQLHRVSGDGALPTGAWRFNARGQVASFTADEGGARVEHVHDYAGERAIRRTYAGGSATPEEVLYFGHAEVRDGRLHRWVFAAGERVAEAPAAAPVPAGGYGVLPLTQLDIVRE